MNEKYFQGSARKRAFMSWGGIVSNSILDNSFLDWTTKFWTTWMQGDYDTSLDVAIIAANNHRPSCTNQAPMMVYGTGSLTWGD